MRDLGFNSRERRDRPAFDLAGTEEARVLRSTGAGAVDPDTVQRELEMQGSHDVAGLMVGGAREPGIRRDGPKCARIARRSLCSTCCATWPRGSHTAPAQAPAWRTSILRSLESILAGARRLR